MKYCRYCFLPENECCAHKFIEFPDNCICDKGEWLAFKEAEEDFEITPICKKFEGNHKDFKICKNCEHDEGCHSK